MASPDLAASLCAGSNVGMSSRGWLFVPAQQYDAHKAAAWETRTLRCSFREAPMEAGPQLKGPAPAETQPAQYAALARYSPASQTKARALRIHSAQSCFG